MNNVFLLLGTNVGDLQKNLSDALKFMAENQIKILRKSKIYRTRAWGKTDQPDFLNMAVEIECPYSPRELLKLIKEIEVKMGRNETVRWGPRIIDIDILFYDNKMINDSDLIIPHPYFFERSFAIIPLAEIAPDFIPPATTKRIGELRNGVSSEGIEIYCD